MDENQDKPKELELTSRANGSPEAIVAETTPQQPPLKKTGFRAYRQALTNSNYRKLWIGEGISNIGNRIHFIALMTYVYTLTGKALDLGLLMIFMTLPNLLLGPLAGVLADRMERRYLMIMSDVARFALVLLIPFTTDLWQIYAISLLMGAANSVFHPSEFSLLPTLVEKDALVTVNSLQVTTMNIVSIIGPALGGLVVAHYGTTPAFLANSGSFLFSALMIWLIRQPKKGYADGKETSVRQLWAEFREGFRYITGDIVFKYIIIFFGVLILCTNGLNPLFIVLTKKVLGGGTQEFGYLISTLGVGGIIGGIIWGAVGNRFERIATIVNLMFIDALFIIFLGLNSNYYLAMAAFFFFGMVGTAFSINIMTFLQEYIPEDKRGRAFGVFAVMFDPLSMASMGIFGTLADWVGVGWMFVGSGALEFITAVFGRFLPVYQRVKGAGGRG
jgi:DHA3 family macrolide efflux protein-like MFS transporter